MSTARTRRARVAALTVLALGACGRVHSVVPAMTTVVDSTGKYPVVTVTGEPPAWHLDSLGVILDSGGVGFQDIHGVLIDPRGGVLVLDRKRPALDRFDDHGTLLGVLGRAGSGPDEYRAPTAIGWIADTLAVYDPMNGRTVRWTRDGRWLGQWLTVGATGQIPIYQAGPDHVWLLQYGVAPNGKPQRNFVRFPQTGANDTLWPPPPHGDGSTREECRWGKGLITFFTRPFSTPSFAVRPTSQADLAELIGRDYRVAIVSPAGDTLRVLSHSLPPVPVTDAEWHDSVADYEAFRDSVSGESCEGSMVRPATKVPVDGLELDATGRIWVQRIDSAGPVWDIWQGDTLVATARGSTRSRYDPIDIRGDRMAIVRDSDDGGKLVVVYRIVAH